MGRIAESVAAETPIEASSKRNKVDGILATLDDEDRPIVVSWLHDVTMSDERIESRLHAADIVCARSTIARWRRHNGVRWVA